MSNVFAGKNELRNFSNKYHIMTNFRLFLILLLGWLMTGCGQPGPLYLPGSKAPIHVEPEPKPESEKDR
jgi:predicted small lipoprotein YifL